MIKLITVFAIVFAGCCAATKPTKAQSPEVSNAPHHEAHHGIKPHQKPDPRLKVKLVTEVENGQTVAHLTVQATGLCTAVTARIVVPEGVSMLAGDKEVSFGPMKSGEERHHRVTIEVPSRGQYTLAGGADCTLNPAVTLNASAVLMLGEAIDVEPTTEVVRPKGMKRGPGLRLAPAKVE